MHVDITFYISTILNRVFFHQVTSLRDEADKAKRECLDIKKMAEERELLLKQEQTALRKVCACELGKFISTGGKSILNAIKL